jgi:hypothetical protein
MSRAGARRRPHNGEISACKTARSYASYWYFPFSRAVDHSNARTCAVKEAESFLGSVWIDDYCNVGRYHMGIDINIRNSTG